MACSLHSIQFFPPELIYVPFIMVLSRQGNWGCAGKEINCWVCVQTLIVVSWYEFISAYEIKVQYLV